MLLFLFGLLAGFIMQRLVDTENYTGATIVFSVWLVVTAYTIF